MKKNNIKPRRCSLEACGSIFTPRNDKGAYCCPQHRLIDNRLRRDKRDLQFNIMLKAFKHNYHILFLYKNKMIITAEELKKIGFDFRYLPVMDENDVHWLGNTGLQLTDNLNYKIIKRNNENK